MIKKLSGAINPKEFPQIFSMVSLLCLFIILSQIIIHQPYFGLMDDWNHLRYSLAKIKSMNFFENMLKAVQDDLSWGMMRLTYPLMVYFLYSVGDSFGSVWFYLVNFLFVSLVLYYCSVVLEGIFKINRYLILSCCFLFPYTYDLFQHPSLQEKLVLFLGFFFLNTMTKGKRGSKEILVLLFTVFLGFMSKASFLIYFAPVVFLIYLLPFFRAFRSPGTKKMSLPFDSYFVLIFGALMVLMSGIVAQKGQYTAAYSVSQIGAHLISLKGMILILFIGGAFYLGRKTEKKHGALSYFPALVFFSFLIVFLPWGFRGYLFSLIAPVMGLFFAIVFLHLFKRKAALFLIIIPCCLIASLRSYGMFVRLYDIRKIVRMGGQFEAMGYTLMRMPCHEGSEALEYYFNRSGL